MLTRSQTKNSNFSIKITPTKKVVVELHRMVTRSQTKNNKRPQINYYEGDDDSEYEYKSESEYESELEPVKIHGPTTQSRRIVLDTYDVPRMVTRSVTKAQKQNLDIDFDGASKIWRKTHPNRWR